MTLSLRMGLAQRVIRTRLEVVVNQEGSDLPGASLVDYLRAVLGSDVRLGLVLGRGEPHQTAVVMAVDRGGALVGFAKVATGPLAQRLLANEASALRRLADLDTPELARLVTARLVRAEHWNGLFVLLTTPLDLSLGQRDSSNLGTSAEVIRALVATGSGERVALRSSKYWSRTTDRANAVLAAETLLPEERERLRALLEALDAGYGADDVELGGCHGDWLPWNRIRRGGVVVVWDWEYWTDSAPVGFDVLHHHCGAVFFPTRQPIDVALRRARERAAGELAALGIVGRDEERLFALYVLEFFLRRLEIASHGGGADDARIFPAILRVVAEVSAMNRS